MTPSWLFFTWLDAWLADCWTCSRRLARLSRAWRHALISWSTWLCGWWARWAAVTALLAREAAVDACESFRLFCAMVCE